MKEQLIRNLEKDLKLSKYKGEAYHDYYARLLYSAIVEWIRVCILDEMFEVDDQTKSKKYIHVRCEEVLKGMLEIFPECKAYFYTKEVCEGDDNPINILRKRMLDNGELLQKKRRVCLPNGYMKSIKKGYCRMCNLKGKFIMKAGISTIVQKETDEHECDVKNLFRFENDVFENLNFLKWERYKEINDFELFNPYLNKPPYKCWTNSLEKLKNNTYLGRIHIQNGLYRYFWTKLCDGELYISPIDEQYIKYEEHRRFILWQRKKYGNSIDCLYKDHNTYIYIKLGAYIPVRERNIFETYGWPFSSIDNKNEFIIPKLFWDEFKEIIENLNFNIRSI